MPEKPVVQLIETDDGSSSLYVPALNETYHSFHGALRESRHIYIKEGLAHWRQIKKESPSASILEVGFGTGLNALLALQFALNEQIKISYTTLEPYPLEPGIVGQLNYPILLQDEVLKPFFQSLHSSEWDKAIPLDPYFLLHKIKTKLEDFEPEKEQYDVVFFDAFAPNKQAEMWTVAALEKVYLSLVTDGVLVTYCAKGQFKRDLKAIGFEVQTLPGPPGKNEMVRAIKKG